MELYGLKYPYLHFHRNPDYYFNEYYLNASGEEVTQLEKLVKDIANQISVATARRQYLISAITEWTTGSNGFTVRHEYWLNCDYKSWNRAEKKYDCGDRFHDNAWWNSEKTSLIDLKSKIDSAQTELAGIEANLPGLDKKLSNANKQLEAARESTFMANMTPQQRADYDAQQTRAKAEAEALKRTADLDAQTRAEAQKASAKQRIILISAAGVALVAGVVMYFVFRKKNVKPAA